MNCVRNGFAYYKNTSLLQLFYNQFAFAGSCL